MSLPSAVAAACLPRLVLSRIRRDAFTGIDNQSGRLRSSYTTSYKALSSHNATKSGDWRSMVPGVTSLYPSRKAAAQSSTQVSGTCASGFSLVAAPAA
ncbi:hypothetical protein PJL18_03822 [Paenarthrobacter nicotinovorans]|nr:hypothetical protein [Paenarthrobacter nicotinovorans]